MAVCEKCGLPDDLCVCEEIVKESMRIKITSDTRRFGKTTTILSGIDGKDIDLRDLAKQLKSKLACGGTVKDGNIELQGEHKERVKEILVTIGYSPESIDIR
jgi:translation initiation factor 1